MLVQRRPKGKGLLTPHSGKEKYISPNVLLRSVEKKVTKSYRAKIQIDQTDGSYTQVNEV